MLAPMEPHAPARCRAFGTPFSLDHQSKDAPLGFACPITATEKTSVSEGNSSLICCFSTTASGVGFLIAVAKASLIACSLTSSEMTLLGAPKAASYTSSRTALYTRLLSMADLQTKDGQTSSTFLETK